MKFLSDLYKDLLVEINRIELKFIDTYLKDPLSGPADYSADVKAYCILCHSYIEDFIESTAKYVLVKCVDKWNTDKQYSLPLLTLLCWCSNNDFIVNKISGTYRPANNRLREVIEKAKHDISIIIEKSNGITEKYLEKYLPPLAIDIPGNQTLYNSIIQLSKVRGDYAHTGVKTTKSPEDIKGYVEDSLKYCCIIKERAIKNVLSDIEYRQYLLEKTIELIQLIIIKNSNN